MNTAAEIAIAMNLASSPGSMRGRVEKESLVSTVCACVRNIT